MHSPVLSKLVVSFLPQWLHLLAFWELANVEDISYWIQIIFALQPVYDVFNNRVLPPSSYGGQPKAMPIACVAVGVGGIFETFLTNNS